jgi:GGDEF domain-containing protein
MLEIAYLKLRDRISATDTMAQVGESSFALILDDVANTASVNEIANALAGCISYARVPATTDDLAGESIGMTSSVGVAMYPDDGRDLESLQAGALELYQDYLVKPSTTLVPNS